MIVMPRRSVTRFFIPLIDVLLLLFVVFLLMPIANLEELEQQRQSAGETDRSIQVWVDSHCMQAQVEDADRERDARVELTLEHYRHLCAEDVA